jgi:caffeoyl-CoA O-methyltransferase
MKPWPSTPRPPPIALRCRSGASKVRLLKLLTSLTRAERALELGTFTGYSTLKIAEGLKEGGTVTTLELDPQYAALARRYFSQSPVGHRVDLRVGPALQTLASLPGPYDLVFIDADKESYPRYFELCVERVRPGGLLIIDNVLWSGKVDDADYQDAETAAIRELNRIIAQDPRVEAVMLTVRDGITLARRR